MGPQFSRSELLFARPSAVEGIARILDFGDTPTEYNRSRNSAEATVLALRSDQQAVKEALDRALDLLRAELREQGLDV